MEGEGAGGLKGFREEPRTLSPAPVGPSNFPLWGVEKPYLSPPSQKRTRQVCVAMGATPSRPQNQL